MLDHSGTHLVAPPPKPTGPARHQTGASRMRPGRGERGSASAELVLATPLLLLLLLGIVQFALWEHATHIAQTAAEQGLAAARVQGGTAAAGQNATEQVLTQLGDGVLLAPTVTSTLTGTAGGGQVHLTVTGRAEPVLPFLHLPVTATATGPLDRFYPDGTTP